MRGYLPGMLQGLHIREVKGRNDHWTHRESQQPVSNGCAGGKAPLGIFQDHKELLGWVHCEDLGRSHPGVAPWTCPSTRPLQALQIDT